MERCRQLVHLAQAERHVEQGAERIARQEQRIAQLRRKGRDVADAETLLRLFRETQDQHMFHRARILKELAMDAPLQRAHSQP